jgi:hypothetical protein
MSSVDNGPITENRIPYYISFFFVLLTFLIIFAYKFDRILVFDVMLHLISPTRGEAASPVLPPQLHAKNAVTSTNLQLTR